MSQTFEAPSIIMPAKFLLLIGQILILVLVLQLRADHIYWGIGFNFSDTSSQYLTAEHQLVGVTICYIICMGFEFLLMVIGISLTYNKYNLLQIFLHFLGCLFSAWFVLDSWKFVYIWPLWACFGALPFLIEIGTIISASRLNADIKANQRGQFRI